MPWNAPYYRRLGFTELPGSALGPQLRAIREREQRAGLDEWPRLAMIRVVATDAPRANGPFGQPG